jgi:hypothetical protein
VSRTFRNVSVRRGLGAEIDDDIVIGAEAIAREVFGNRLNARQIYRLPEENPPWPIVRVRGKTHVPTLHDAGACGAT